MSFTILPFESEEQWLATRRKHVSATDINRLAAGGRATWDAIHREKDTGERDFHGNRFTEWGKQREPIIGEWVTAFMEPTLHPTRDVYVLDGTQISCTPDMVDERAHILCEIKTKRGGWDTPPQAYLDQIQVQLMVTGADHCLLVMEPYDYAADGGFEVVGNYWFERIYPDPDRQAYLRHLVDLFLAREYPEPYAPEELQALVDDFLDAKARMEEAKAGIEKVCGIEKNTFELVGAKVIVSPEGKSRRFAKSKFEEAHPDLVALFTETVPVKPKVTIRKTKEAA